uniref:Fatty acid hydroxylase domain-containing protein n=1 Tax=Clastoptera arizonana TaxID=38151 RepID=A0A1B6DA27_9HEMI
MSMSINGNPLYIKWFKNFSDYIYKFWVRFPQCLFSLCISVAVFLFGTSLRGEWLHALIHILRYFGKLNDDFDEPDEVSDASWENITMESLCLKNLFWYWSTSLLIGFLIYFSFGGFIHWYFYVHQRDTPEKWKCQPQKWLPPDLERNEIYVGTLSLICANSVSSIMACYVANGGRSAMYQNITEYPLIWFVLQWPVIFLYQDYVTYWAHRMYHTPFLYKHFHKLHHRYKQPTAFSVTAIHPVEIVHIQIITQAPFIFLVPVNFISFYTILFYTFYNGIIDHSGVDIKAPWWQPWRPDTIFHDNHHQYFHVNFAFNCYFWDIIHETYRKTDRIYNEDIYYGHGKPIGEANGTELKAEIEERLTENVKAYRSHNYLLDKSILDSKMK